MTRFWVNFCSWTRLEHSKIPKMTLEANFGIVEFWPLDHFFLMFYRKITEKLILTEIEKPRFLAFWDAFKSIIKSPNWVFVENWTRNGQDLLICSKIKNFEILVFVVEEPRNRYFWVLRYLPIKNDPKWKSSIWPGKVLLMIFLTF